MIPHHDLPSHPAFISALAKHILQDAAQPASNYQHIQILLPNALSARQCREALLTQHQGAILGPVISSLPQWINANIPLPENQHTIINAAGRQLMLFQALKQHQHLFQETNLWQICNSLLQFFEELSHSHFRLQDLSFDDWQSQLINAYNINSENKNDLQHLFYEARLVHTLWKAWLDQSAATHILDETAAYHARLNQNPQPHTLGMQFYVLGFAQLSPAEQQWCQHLHTANNICLINPSPESNSSATSSLTIFNSQDAETEARAIHLQTRIWLSENKNSIAIVSENRKLMRRVRALMERSHISVEDTAGWSIATTSAAACLERWLQCIEQDFAWQPLLDLLKSPFFCPPEQRSEHLKQIFRLQQDIIIYERISADLNRYRHAILQRQQRLHWSPDVFPGLLTVLNRLEKSALRLRHAASSKQPHHTTYLMTILLDSLNDLGIRSQLESDTAGDKVLATLQSMKTAAEHLPGNMSWHDFRTWLGSVLEQQAFTPKNKPSTVHLLNLKQAEFCEFDAVIVASANAEYLPGKPSATPFFNQPVRRALKLKTWSDEKADNLNRFRQLLRAGQSTLITWQSEHDGEWLQASPWVQDILDQAQLADIDLHHPALNALLKQETENSLSNFQPHTQPSPAALATLIPDYWSVSAYQRVVDCPYKYFAADVLALRAEEQITRELQRAEYGEKAHESLRAFFEQRPGLPAPFGQMVNEHNKIEAAQHLNKIAEAAFSRDIENNLQHRGWLQQWQATASRFIDWLIERQLSWQFHQAEVDARCQLDAMTQLRGRLDLIEKNKTGFAIIDYKTGASPKTPDVVSGENVQLIAYALLMDEVREKIREVAFLELSKDKTKFSANIADDELHQLAADNRERLIAITHAIQNEQGLTAWGDNAICKHCDMSGLCRKQIWQSL